MADDFFVFGNVEEKKKNSSDIEKAEFFYSNGNIEKAKSIYLKTLDKQYDNVLAYFGLLRIYSKDFTIIDDQVQILYIVIKMLDPKFNNEGYQKIYNLIKKEDEKLELKISEIIKKTEELKKTLEQEKSNELKRQKSNI